MTPNRFGPVLFTLTGLAIQNVCAASVINFDDVPFPGGNPLAVSSLSPGYQGLDWSGGHGATSWNVSPNDATGWYGGTKQPYSHSGNNFAWSNSGTNLEITAHGGGNFDLTGFWIRTWPSVNPNVTAHGYLNGSELFTQTFSASDTYAQITTNFAAIDRFTLTVPSPVNLLIDDITVKNITSSTPAPGSLMTLMLGAVPGAYALLRRRRQKAA